MKLFTTTAFICSSFFLLKNQDPSRTTLVSPLAAYSVEWNKPAYLKCNTAAKAKYMTASEKEVIYILNLAQTNPSLFASTVVQQYPDKGNGNVRRTSTYYTSLLSTMKEIKPAGLLMPDSLCFAGAQCHAINSGKEGYVGHNRSKDDCLQKWYFNGECCDYGHDQPLDIVMALLIDQGVPSLGHREICLAAYKKIGVSIQPHIRYGHNAVIDFHF